MCICGLTAKGGTVFLRWPGLSPVSEGTVANFTSCMMIGGDEYSCLDPAQFINEGASILSLLILTPQGFSQEGLLSLQAWLGEAGLLTFAAAGGLSNGEGDGCVCKHVHVPGMGPEIDVSPAGVNKGSAILKLLDDPLRHLGVDCNADGSDIAVFGDAGNDVELFGMKRDATGQALEPLYPDTGGAEIKYRPAIRCAMPWANDPLLIADSNVVSTCDKVLARFGHGS